MITVEAVKAHWKKVAAALVAVAVAAGVALPEGTVDQSTELVGMVAAGGIGLYALGLKIRAKIRARSKENSE